MDILRQLKDRLGAIDDAEKERVCDSISAGSHPTQEYFIMLVISAVIATIGLLTNSVAALIGAMLVSPLLLPVIGISLGAVKGDFKLFYTAIEAEAKGVAIVIPLVALLTLLIPNASITSEILLRTHPTPLDLMVALGSGAAAAYALSRKGISAALPGVAIAVAVMPPLCVVGIGFAMRNLAVAFGGGLTFLANVVAINFAASIVFWLMSFGPSPSQAAHKETLGKIGTSAVLLLLILVPLAWIMAQSIQADNDRALIGQVLSSQLDGIPQAELAGFESAPLQNGTLRVTAAIESVLPITPSKAGEMRVSLEKNLGRPVELDLRVTEIRLVQAT